MSASQAIANMATVFAIVKVADYFKIDVEENTAYIRLAYATTQLIIFTTLAFVWFRVNGKQDTTPLRYTETTPSFGSDPNNAEPEVVETTHVEYDKKQVLAVAGQTALQVAIMAGIHYKWGYLRPLFLQAILGYKTLYSMPLVQVHVVGAEASGTLARPWRPANPFAPPAPADGAVPPAATAAVEAGTPEVIKAEDKAKANGTKDSRKRLNRMD